MFMKSNCAIYIDKNLYVCSTVLFCDFDRPSYRGALFLKFKNIPSTLHVRETGELFPLSEINLDLLRNPNYTTLHPIF